MSDNRRHSDDAFVALVEWGFAITTTKSISNGISGLQNKKVKQWVWRWNNMANGNTKRLMGKKRRSVYLRCDKGGEAKIAGKASIVHAHTRACAIDVETLGQALNTGELRSKHGKKPMKRPADHAKERKEGVVV